MNRKGAGKRTEKCRRRGDELPSFIYAGDRVFEIGACHFSVEIRPQELPEATIDIGGSLGEVETVEGVDGEPPVITVSIPAPRIPFRDDDERPLSGALYEVLGFRRGEP